MRLDIPMLALVGLLAAGQAQAAPFCPTLKSIVAAAGATPSWKGVSQGGKGTAIPTGFKSCSTSSYSSSADYNCSLDLTAGTVDGRYEKLVAEVQACLGAKAAVSGDDIGTYSQWSLPGGVEVTATRIRQVNANSYGIGLGVRLSF